MGSAEGDDDEQPVHEVTLDGFWIDQTEVTNVQYERCVTDGDCEASRYADDTDFNKANYPVIGMSWHDATTYCEWAGGRLPTEAEWEYAARGEAENKYPWGNEDPTCGLAQFSGCFRNTVSVGSFPDGASWCDALDMAGNVWEWVSDWYDADYYEWSPVQNPTGPASGKYRVLRGGSWDTHYRTVRAINRFRNYPNNTYNDNGFRCVAVVP